MSPIRTKRELKQAGLWSLKSRNYKKLLHINPFKRNLVGTDRRRHIPQIKWNKRTDLTTFSIKLYGRIKKKFFFILTTPELVHGMAIKKSQPKPAPPPPPRSGCRYDCGEGSFPRSCTRHHSRLIIFLSFPSFWYFLSVVRCGNHCTYRSCSLHCIKNKLWEKPETGSSTAFCRR